MSGADRPDLRRKGPRDRRLTVKVEVRGEWALKRRMEEPAMLYRDMIAAIRAEFNCGEVTAQQAITRSYELLAELRGEKYLEGLADQLTAVLLENLQLSRKEGNRTEVRKTVAEIRKYLGLGAPDRIEFTDKTDVDAEDASDEEIAMALDLLSPKKKDRP